jgi:ribonuclease E
MKFYYLDTKFTSGKYKGQTLEEVHAKDPEYIENALKEDDNFLLTEEVIDELQTVNPDYSFSDEAVSRRDSKEREFDKSSDGADDDDDDFEDKYDDDFEDTFDIEDIGEDDLEDLDDIYDDDDDDLDDDYSGDFDDFADDSSWDRF